MYEALDSLVQFTARGRCTEIFLQVFCVVEFLHHFVMFQFALFNQPLQLQKKDVELKRETKANSDSHTCRKLGTWCVLKHLEDFPHACVRDVPFKAVTSVPMPREGTRLQFRVKCQLRWSPALTSQNQGTWWSRSFWWVPQNGENIL